MDQSAGPMDPATDTQLQTSRGWTFLVVAAVVLVVGLGASATGAWVSHRSALRSEDRVARSQAQSKSSALAVALRRDMDFVDSQEGLFLSVPQVTNKQLADWYGTLQVRSRYPGTIGFGFVQRVPAANLEEFGA